MSYVIALVVVTVVASAWLFYRMTKEVVSDIKVLNPDSDKGTALVEAARYIRDIWAKV